MVPDDRGHVLSQCSVSLRMDRPISRWSSECRSIWRFEPDPEGHTQWPGRSTGVRWACGCRWQGLDCFLEEGEAGPSADWTELRSWGLEEDQVIGARARLVRGLFVPRAPWNRMGEFNGENVSDNT